MVGYIKYCNKSNRSMENL